MRELKQHIGKVKMYRDESYNHRTTPLVSWVVTCLDENQKEWVVRECSTKREALEWVNIYTKDPKTTQPVRA